MNIVGTIFLVDEPHLDVLKQNLMTNPPPKGRAATGTMLCMDMDESDNMLEIWFPDHCQKATLLCPPPIAMYKEIDGDQEGFIQCYNDYLEHDNSVQDFLANMLLFLHVGGNILLYTPSYIEDDTIWINTLMMFFFTRFGITIGTSATANAAYDPRYDSEVAYFMYSHGCMNVFDFINSNIDPYPLPLVQDRVIQDLLPYCAPEDNPLDLYTYIHNCPYKYGTPVYKSGIIFDRQEVF